MRLKIWIFAWLAFWAAGSVPLLAQEVCMSLSTQRMGVTPIEYKLAVQEVGFGYYFLTGTTWSSVVYPNAIPLREAVRGFGRVSSDQIEVGVETTDSQGNLRSYAHVDFTLPDGKGTFQMTTLRYSVDSSGNAVLQPGLSSGTAEFFDCSAFRGKEIGTLLGSEALYSLSPAQLKTEIGEAAKQPLRISDLLTGFDFVPNVAPGNGPLDALWEMLEKMGKLDPPLRPTDAFKLTYTMPGYQDPLTALLVVPYGPSYIDDPFSAPLLAFQHPTQVKRSQSPSNAKNHPIDDQFTIPVAQILAQLGFIVVVADYPGLGDNYDIHPYCTSELGKVVVATLDAGLQKLGELKQIPAPKNYGVSWNGKVYLAGFSEGGYATLVAAKELQARHSSRYTIAGVAAMDGPHSLSETMRKVMLTATRSYTAPYFLPCFVAAYGNRYGAVAPLLKFENAILSRKDRTGSGWGEFNSSLYRLVAQKKGDPDVTSAILSGKMMEVAGYNGPGSVLTNALIRELGRSDSAVVGILNAENSFSDWTPSSSYRVLLMHNIYDDYVPVGNSALAFEAWRKQARVDFVPFVEYIPGLGSVHGGALIPAYISAIQWLNALEYPQRLP